MFQDECLEPSTRTEELALIGLGLGRTNSLVDPANSRTIDLSTKERR